MKAFQRFLLFSLLPFSTFAQFGLTAAQRDSLNKLTAADHANMKQTAHQNLAARPKRQRMSAQSRQLRRINGKPLPYFAHILTLKNGNKVTSAEAWWSQRRPELIEEFEREIYGRLPKNIPKVTWKVEAVDNEFVGRIPVVAKKLTGHVDNSAYPSIKVDINMTSVIPTNVKSPIPILMMFGRPSFPSPAQPNNDDFEKINAAFKEMLIKSNPEMKAIFDKYPAYSPVSRASLPNFFAPLPNGDSPGSEQLLAAGWGYCTIDPSRSGR